MVLILSFPLFSFIYYGVVGSVMNEKNKNTSDPFCAWLTLKQLLCALQSNFRIAITFHILFCWWKCAQIYKHVKDSGHFCRDSAYMIFKIGTQTANLLFLLLTLRDCVVGGMELCTRKWRIHFFPFLSNSMPPILSFSSHQYNIML